MSEMLAAITFVKPRQAPNQTTQKAKTRRHGVVTTIQSSVSGRSTLVRGVCAPLFQVGPGRPLLAFSPAFCCGPFLFANFARAGPRNRLRSGVRVAALFSPNTHTHEREASSSAIDRLRAIMSCVVCVSIVAPPPRPRDRSGWLAACVKRTAALFCGGPAFPSVSAKCGGALEILNVRLGTATQKKTTHKADWLTTPAPHTHGKNRLCASAIVPGSRCGSGVAA